MENYKEKYEQILSRAKIFIQRWEGIKTTDSELALKELKEIFPELKESEDEKIRKALIHLISEQDGFLTAINGISVKDILAWLEKQSKKSNILQDTEDDLRRQNTIQVLEYARSLDAYNQYGKESINKDIAWLKKQDEQNTCLPGFNEVQGTPILKQGEQKPTNKIEPKFKVGDWITNGDLIVGQVTSFNEEYYYYMYKGIKRSLHISNANNWHLWTIQDAKDGDVLANENMVLIFKCFEEPSYRQHIISYIGLDTCGYIQITNESWNLGLNGAHPATKEQRDLLFQKMKEAGYEWNNEKKELKKIEQKPTEWSDRDWYFYSKLESFLEVKDHYSPTESSSGYQKDVHETLIWLKSLRPNKYVTWSEEDENLLKLSIENLTELKNQFGDGYGKVGNCISWLKSLKNKLIQL